MALIFFFFNWIFFFKDNLHIWFWWLPSNPTLRNPVSSFSRFWIYLENHHYTHFAKEPHFLKNISKNLIRNYKKYDFLINSVCFESLFQIVEVGNSDFLSFFSNFGSFSLLIKSSSYSYFTFLSMIDILHTPNCISIFLPYF